MLSYNFVGKNRPKKGKSEGFILRGSKKSVSDSWQASTAKRRPWRPQLVLSDQAKLGMGRPPGRASHWLDPGPHCTEDSPLETLGGAEAPSPHGRPAGRSLLGCPAGKHQSQSNLSPSGSLLPFRLSRHSPLCPEVEVSKNIPSALLSALGSLKFRALGN